MNRPMTDDELQIAMEGWWKVYAASVQGAVEGGTAFRRVPGHALAAFCEDFDLVPPGTTEE